MGKGFRIHDVDDRVVLEDAQDSVEVLLCDEVGDVDGMVVIDYKGAGDDVEHLELICRNRHDL